MRRLKSLRFQLTVAATTLVAVLVTLAGITIAERIYAQDRSRVDTELTERAAKVAEDFDKNGPGEALEGDKPNGARNDSGNELLAGSDSLVRVLVDGVVVDERGDIPTADIPRPDRNGVSTVRIDGQEWRSLVTTLDAATDTQLQVLQSLEPVSERFDANVGLIALVTAGAVVLTGVGLWIVAGLLLRPLERLRAGALAIQPGASSQQLPVVDHPQEVADLSDTLNGMLDRLQSSSDATRRFAADAGHELRTPLTALGMDLETLTRHPDLTDAQRGRMLAAMTAEHQRLSSLLSGLLTLARGDAEALPARSLVDLDDIAQTATDAAQRRHPTVTYSFVDDGAARSVSGWPDGIRLAIDNLLDNAARYGRPDGTVTVAVSGAADHQYAVTVCDDGPGIPSTDRERLTQRFTRGADSTPGGSGLGLALVQQQARLHGGDLRLGDAPSGGLAATVSFPAAD